VNTPLVVSLLRRGNFVYTLFQSSSSFLIMNNEHIERTMNFIVQQQARTTEILTRATEAVAQTAEAITQLANSTHAGFADTHAGFADVNAKINALVEAQIQRRERRSHRS